MRGEGKREGKGREGDEEENCFELLVHCVHMIEFQSCYHSNRFFPLVHAQEIMPISHSSPRRAGCGLGGDHHSVTIPPL